MNWLKGCCKYYRVENLNALNLTIKTVVFDFEGEGDVLQSFRWVKLADLEQEDFLFPTDQHVANLLMNKI